MNITDTLASQILENLGIQTKPITEAKKTEPKTDEKPVEEKKIEHSCPLCESKLEVELTEEKIENFVNSLVIEEGLDELDADEEDNTESKTK